MVVVSPGRLGEMADGSVELGPKTVSGLLEYSRHWPGEVVFVAQRRPDRDLQALSFDWPQRSALPIETHLVDDVAATVKALSPRVTLAPAEPESRHLLGLSGATVVVADYPLRVRWENQTIETKSKWRQARVGLGLARRWAALRPLLQQAQGLQCNGPDTFNAYARYNPNPLKFYDSRITDDMLGLAEQQATHFEEPLTMGFSGRWIAPKGVLDAIAVCDVLQKSGKDVRLKVFGNGPLGDQVDARKSETIEVVGGLEFESQWVPAVMSGVDVFVLPHRQADSSSTFVEAIGCGVPVIGYANRYWKALRAEVGAGWTTEMSPGAIADRIASLTPEQLQEARRAGLEWMKGHTFEAEFARRTAHLREIASL